METNIKKIFLCPNLKKYFCVQATPSNGRAWQAWRATPCDTTPSSGVYSIWNNIIIWNNDKLSEIMWHIADKCRECSPDIRSPLLCYLQSRLKLSPQHPQHHHYNQPPPPPTTPTTPPPSTTTITTPQLLRETGGAWRGRLRNFVCNYLNHFVQVRLLWESRLELSQSSDQRLS